MAQEVYRELFNSASNVRGTWYPTPSLNVPWTIEISGISGDTVQIRCSNSPTQPGAATDQSQYGTDITADALVEITVPFAWVMVKKTAGASTVVAKMFAQSMP